MGNMLRVDCLCRVSTVRNVRTSVRGSGQQSMSRHEKSRLAQASLLLVDPIGIEPKTLRMRTVRSRKVVSFLPTDCGVWYAKN